MIWESIFLEFRLSKSSAPFVSEACMKKNKLLCLILTVLLSLALIAGGGAILTVADALESKTQESAGEGEDIEVSSSAENIVGTWTASGTNYYKLYNYTGGVQSVVLPRGSYKLEAWGAQGGNDGKKGGHGGYASGVFTITGDTTVYIVIGGAGQSSCGGTGGGYNGGGNSGSYGSSGAGGGATHFATATGLLKDLKGNKAAVLLVAGGGGGGGNGADCVGWGGGSSPGPNAAGTGALTNNESFFGQGQASQMGLSAGTNNDGGGGGGGYYGGAGATTDTQGAGGSAYAKSTLTSQSFINGNASMPNPSSYGANYTKNEANSGLNGYARIVRLNAPPTSKNAAFTIGRTTTGAIGVTAVASDTDAGDTLNYVAQKIYTDAACATEATEYFTYTATSATSITVHPKKRFATTTFYTKVKDSYNAQTVVSFTVNASAYTPPAAQTYGLKNNNTGIYGNSAKTGSNYPAISSISSTAFWNTTSDIYNPTATGRRTYMITRPLELQSSTRWNGFTSATINIADLAKSTDAYSGTLLDDVYITTYSASGHGTNYTLTTTGANAKWTSLTITPLLSSSTGWFVIPITIGMFEKSTDTELSTTAQRISVDIVFRIGNERPTLKQFKTVELNTTTATTATVSIADLLNDRNGNTLDFYNKGTSVIDKVKVPEYEYMYVDKFGTLLTAANYNVGGTGGAAAIDDPFSSVETGFQESSIHNAALANETNIHKEAYVTYAINGSSLQFTAIRATRSQYSDGRASAGLGHFYIVVHISDSGDPRDTGLWYPIAIRVTDNSAPVVRALDYTFDAPDIKEGMTAAQITAAQDAAKTEAPIENGDGTVSRKNITISPYFLSTNPSKGVGSLDPLDFDDASEYVDEALGNDISEFGLGIGTDGINVDYAFNDFLYVNSDFGDPSSTGNYFLSYRNYLGYREYVTPEIVKLYAPASYFDRLTAAQKTKAGIKELTLDEKTAFGFADPANVHVVSFDGIRLTALQSTLERWVEVPLRLTDIFDNVTETTIAIKVNNRNSAVRSEMNRQGIALQKTNYYKQEADGSFTPCESTDAGAVARPAIVYSIHNTNVSAGVDESFSITPYDLVFDADLSSLPVVNNDDPAKTNSNPKNDSAFKTLEAALAANTNYGVYVRDSVTGTGALTPYGHDRLSFVVGSLPFAMSGTDPDTATYTQTSYNNELTLGYTRKAGGIDYISVSPKIRNRGDSAYTLNGVRITDTSGVEVLVDIEIRVINSKPKLVNPSQVLYLKTDFSDPATNNSNDEPYYTEGNSGNNFTTAGYNVREFVINEMVTDDDSTDIAALEIVSVPKIGTIIDGKFVEMTDGTDYISIEHNVMGTGHRSSYAVTRITAKSSTQALETGLFVQLEVTDKYNRTLYGNLHDGDAGNDAENSLTNTVYLAFQVEVLNSAPKLAVGGQFETESGSEDGNVVLINKWTAQPVNVTETLASRYIAPDEATARMLTETGYYETDGASATTRVLADNVRFFLKDYDARQKLMPYAENAALLPQTGYDEGLGSGWDQDIAVKFDNPYGTVENEADIKNTVKFVWFVNDGGSFYLVDLDALLEQAKTDISGGTFVDAEGNPSTDPYDLVVPHTGKSLAYCLENDVLYWAVRISPKTAFDKDGINIHIRYRDSSPEGGCTQTVVTDGGVTQTRNLAYKGNRGENGTREQIKTNNSASFNLKIGALGMTRNTVAFSAAEDPENVNRYFAYHIEGADPDYVYEPVYPAEEFYYNPLTLGNDANAQGVEPTAYIPLSYLAVPETILDNMAQTVDFDTSYYLDSQSYRKDSDKTRNMLMSMSLYDPATGYSWTGTEILDNPYFDIEYTESSELDSSPNLNKNLYYSVEKSVNASGIMKRDRTKPLREDLFGFALRKKNVRTNGYLELTVTLGAFTYESHDSNTDTTVSGASATRMIVEGEGEEAAVSRETVKLRIAVTNDNIKLTDHTKEISTATLKNNATFVVGRQDVVLSLVNDPESKDALADSDYRLFAEYDMFDYKKANVRQPDAEEFNERTFKENAYFLYPSYAGNLDEAQLNHIFETDDSGKLVNTYINDADPEYTQDKVIDRLAAYFGVDRSLIENAVNGTAGAIAALDAAKDINHKYTNFFTVAPLGRDSANLTFHAVRRISVNVDTAWDYYVGNVDSSAVRSLDEELKAVNEYIKTVDDLEGVRAKIEDGKIVFYYPFRAIVYDDYVGTGFLDGSYAILEADVLIGNSDPYTNEAMVSKEKPKDAILEGDRYFDIDIAKGEVYTLRISDLFGDNNMSMDETVRAFRRKEDITNVLEMNVSDYFKCGTNKGYTQIADDDVDTLTLEAATSTTDVGIDFSGFYMAAVPVDGNNSSKQPANTSRSVVTTATERGQIRITAINRTRNNVPVEFKLVFTDGEKYVSVVVRVKVGNQAPVPLMTQTGTSYLPESVTMRTGEVFTVLVTSWDRYITGVKEVDSSIGAGPDIDTSNFGDDFYKDTINDEIRKKLNDRYSINGNPDDYKQFAARSNPSNASESSSNRFMKFDFSAVSDKASDNMNYTKFIKDSSGGEGTYSYVDTNGVTHDSGSLGFLCLADDDLPWGLKFRNTDPRGIKTNAVEYTTVNLLGNDLYAMAFQFRARSSVTDLPITLTAYDAEGKSVRFTFRITVLNTNPTSRRESIAEDNPYGVSYDPDEAGGIYKMTMNVGQSFDLPVTLFCADADAGDEAALRTQRSFNGSAFSIDGLLGTSSNDFFTLEDRGRSVRITCDNAFLGNKTYTDVIFRVVDPIAAVPVEIPLRIYTRYGAISDPTSLSPVSVNVTPADKFAESGEATVMQLVDGRGVSTVRDPDYGSNVTYEVNVYTLFDISDGKMTATERDENYDDAVDGVNCILSYNPVTGVLSENDNLTAQGKRDFMRKYFDITISADGSQATFVPRGATLDTGAFPLYFKLTKVVEGASIEPNTNITGHVSANVTVGDSAPTAIRESVANNNSFGSAVGNGGIAPSEKFLTVRGTAGYSQKYFLWNRDNADLGLFYDRDADDEITFVGAEVVNNGVYDGWQEDASRGLPQAFSVGVNKDENGRWVLTATIVRKVVNPENRAEAFILPVRVTVKDRSGAEVSTIITFEIHNSAPSFIASPATEDRDYEIVFDEENGEYLLELKLEGGTSKTFDLREFLSDVDTISNGESYTITEGSATETSLEILNYIDSSSFDKVVYAGEEAFAVKLADESNLMFKVDALSYDRGNFADVVMKLRDSSLAETLVPLRIRFKVANSAPKLIEDVSTTITLLGGNGADGDSLGESAITVNVTDWVTDANPADLGVEGSRTYIRVYAWVLGNIVAHGETIAPSDETNLFNIYRVSDAVENPYQQKLVITPLAGRYGSQTVTVYVRDDGGREAATESEGWAQESFTLTVEIARDPSTITLNNLSLPYMREIPVSLDDLVPYEYSLGYELNRIWQSIEISEGTIGVELRDGEYYIKAAKSETEVSGPVKMFAEFTVGGKVQSIPFSVTILKNNAPDYRVSADGAIIKAFDFETDVLDVNGVIRLTPEQLYVDPEEDVMKFLRVESSHTFIVKAEIDSSTGELVISFASRGSAELDIYVTDATGREFRRPITVTNTTLPELNFFLSFAQSFVLRPWLYIGILIAIILLIIIIIFIADQRRRKKREQAEVEALLVSEMQLEEQMLKLASAQSPDGALPQGQLDVGVPPPMGLPMGEDDDSFDDSI